MAESKTDLGSGNPFHVRTNDGVFHSGWKTEDKAIERANRANKTAKELGIKVRYEAGPRPTTA